MTLDDAMAVILRYIAEFGTFAETVQRLPRHKHISGWVQSRTNKIT